MNQRGFTLMELIVSMGLGLFISTAAFSVAGYQLRLSANTRDNTNKQSASRGSLNQIAYDLRMAGSGVGYQPDNSFAGLMRGAFQVQGGATFTADNGLINLDTGTFPTDDLGIRTAPGERRTIAAWQGVSAEICRGNFMPTQAVTMMTSNGMHTRAVKLTSVSDVACSDGICTDGCSAITWHSNAIYQSHANAAGASYRDGVMFADYREVIWFVVPDAQGRGELRRAELTADDVCGARDSTCGGVSVRNVETLQIAVFGWDPAAQQWVDYTNAGSVQSRDRIRVDIEMVVRGKQDEMNGAQRPKTLELAPGVCIPECNPPPDEPILIRRHVLRTTVNIRNAGKLSLR